MDREHPNSPDSSSKCWLVWVGTINGGGRLAYQTESDKYRVLNVTLIMPTATPGAKP